MSSTHTDPTPESPTSPAPSHEGAGATPDPAAPPASGVARGSARRGCVSVALGVLLVLVGIPMLVCPGPGVATVAAGLGMIAVGLGLRRAGGDT